MKDSPIWYPFTQEKLEPSPLKVIKGEGSSLTLENGQMVIDMISSWWVNLHGHCHPKIAEAIYAQAKTLEHVIFARFTHNPAIQVAEKLLSRVPSNLNKVFFSDNGSTAVEVAIKMALQYWKNLGLKKNRLIAFEGSYHGDTLGAMSVGSRSLFSAPFNEMLFEVDFVPFPATFEGDPAVEEKEAAALSAISKLFKEETAAVIIEPLVQGAGGMRMCREEFLQKLETLIKKSGALLIYDEVMTGFGRTGDWFASTRSDTKPDILCLAKGLTGGFLPLAVTLASNEVYQTFNSENPAHTFYHGHSYTANPLGCAAAIASLNLLEEHLSVVKSFEKRHKQFLPLWQNHPALKEVRVKGSIVAANLKGNTEGYLNKAGKQLREDCLAKGILIRPLGDVVYFLPPYCLTDKELEMAYRIVAEAL